MGKHPQEFDFWRKIYEENQRHAEKLLFEQLSFNKNLSSDQAVLAKSLQKKQADLTREIQAKNATLTTKIALIGAIATILASLLGASLGFYLSTTSSPKLPLSEPIKETTISAPKLPNTQTKSALKNVSSPNPPMQPTANGGG